MNIREELKNLSHKKQIEFALFCALQVKHLMKDERSLDALVKIDLFINDKITISQMRDATAAAYAAYAASAVSANTAAIAGSSAAYAAASAAYAASTSYDDIAASAAYAPSVSANTAAAYAVYDAASYVAFEAASAATKEKQIGFLKTLLEGNTLL